MIGAPPRLRDERGKPDKHGLCAVQGLDLIPPPHVAIVETQFELPYQGVMYNGRIDFLHGYRPGVEVTIGDHKTISKLSRAKTPEQLLEDPQRIIYSAWAAVTFGVSHVRASWVYYQRTNPRAKRVDLLEDSASIWQRFRRLHGRVGLPIYAAKQITHPHAFPRNLDSCQLYPPHGCPYAAECLQGVSGAELAAHALAKALPAAA